MTPSARTLRRTTTGRVGPRTTTRISSPPGPMGASVAPNTKRSAPVKPVLTSISRSDRSATSGASCAAAPAMADASIATSRSSLAITAPGRG
jgi:hypothetical protein